MTDESRTYQRRASDVAIARIEEGMKYWGLSIEDLSRTCHANFARLDEKLQALNDEGLPRRIGRLESIFEWAMRIVGGALLLALMSLVLRSAGNP